MEIDKPEHMPDFVKLKEVNDANKKKIYVEKYKSNYQKYKLKIKNKREINKKVVACECGRNMNEKYKDKHIKTKIHLSAVNKI